MVERHALVACEMLEPVRNLDARLCTIVAMPFSAYPDHHTRLTTAITIAPINRRTCSHCLCLICVVFDGICLQTYVWVSKRNYLSGAKICLFAYAPSPGHGNMSIWLLISMADFGGGVAN
jgi:hypothetical protein